MIKGSQVRKSDQSIDRLFLDRWSPRAFSGQPLSEAELMTLLEAARWAPSSGNVQPWRILYARKDTAAFATFFGLLGEGNQPWCKNAGALLVLVSKMTNNDDKPSITHSFDTGAAWENLALQATLSGLVAHGMQGFDYARAKTELNVPDGFAVEAMVALGHPGKVEELPEKYQKREVPSPRLPLTEIACEGSFAFPPKSSAS